MADPSDSPDQVRAYKAARRDERLQDDAPSPDRRFVKTELDEAYQRGRREGRAARSTSPAIAIVLVILAAFGVLVLTLAARNGSFTAAGASIDQVVSSSVHQASTPVRDAANQAGDALQNAGQSLKRGAQAAPH